MAEQQPFISTDWDNLKLSVQAAKASFAEEARLKKSRSKAVPPGPPIPSVADALDDLTEKFRMVNSSPLNRVRENPSLDLPGTYNDAVTQVHSTARRLRHMPEDDITEEDWAELMSKGEVMFGEFADLTGRVDPKVKKELMAEAMAKARPKESVKELDRQEKARKAQKVREEYARLMAKYQAMNGRVARQNYAPPPPPDRVGDDHDVDAPADDERDVDHDEKKGLVE